MKDGAAPEQPATSTAGQVTQQVTSEQTTIDVQAKQKG